MKKLIEKIICGILIISNISLVGLADVTESYKFLDHSKTLGFIDSDMYFPISDYRVDGPKYLSRVSDTVLQDIQSNPKVKIAFAVDSVRKGNADIESLINFEDSYDFVRDTQSSENFYTDSSSPRRELAEIRSAVGIANNTTRYQGITGLLDTEVILYDTHDSYISNGESVFSQTQLTENLKKAFDKAIESNIDIFVLPGSCTWNNECGLQEYIDKARESGILVVGCGYNSSEFPTQIYPSKYTGVYVQNDRLEDHSNGYTIPIGILDDKYDDEYYSVTSNAVWVGIGRLAGTLAYMKAIDPTLTEDDIETLFAGTCIRTGEYNMDIAWYNEENKLVKNNRGYGLVRFPDLLGATYIRKTIKSLYPKAKEIVSTKVHQVTEPIKITLNTKADIDLATIKNSLEINQADSFLQGAEKEEFWNTYIDSVTLETDSKNRTVIKINPKNSKWGFIGGTFVCVHDLQDKNGKKLTTPYFTLIYTIDKDLALYADMTKYYEIYDNKYADDPFRTRANYSEPDFIYPDKEYIEEHPAIPIADDSIVNE